MDLDCRIHTWRTSECRYLIAPPLPEVAEELRRLVPERRLDYDPLRNVWRITGTYWLALRRALVEDLGLGPVQEYGSRAEYEAANPDAPASSPAVHDHEAFETLFLLPGAPPSVVEAAYRALAKIHHPDCGGDARRMSVLNAAYTAIRQSA